MENNAESESVIHSGGNDIPTNSVLKLTNAKIVDVTGGCFFESDVEILIQNGKILAMPGLKPGPENGGSENQEPDTKPDIKSGTKSNIRADFTMDLKGKTVMPGLFNVHCHAQIINPTFFSNLKSIKARKKYHDLQVEKNMADCFERGVTNIRDAYSDDLRPGRLIAERIKNGEINGPRIMQAVVVGARGGYLTPEVKGFKKVFLKTLGVGNVKYEDPASGVIAFPVDAGSQQIKDAVNQAIDERGADLIKVGESMEKSILNSDPMEMSMEQMEAITDQARKRGVQSTIHCVSVRTFRRAVAAGFSSLAHMPRDGQLTKEDIDAFSKSGCIIEPTLSVGYDMGWHLEGDALYNGSRLEILYNYRDRTFEKLAKDFWIPELGQFVVEGFNKATLGKYKMLGILNLSKLLVHFNHLINYGVTNTKMLLDDGAVMACGNDGGVQACTPAMVAHELAMFDLFMNDEGHPFDGATAVRTATINSAKSMGIDKRFGSIQTGKVADLAIIDGNPFEDISLIGSKVDALFVDGKLSINKCGLKTQNMTLT